MMDKTIAFKDVMHNESSSFNSGTLTDCSYPVTQARVEILGKFDTEVRLLGEAINTKGCNRPKDMEDPTQGADMRRIGQAPAGTHCLDQEEGAVVKSDITGVHRNTELHNDITINMHARETLLTLQVEAGSNSKRQGGTMFEEWTRPKMTENQAVHSHQPHLPVKQEVKGRILVPIWDSETTRQTTKVCDIEAKENDVQGKEKARDIYATESYRNNAKERDVHTPPIVAEASVNVTVPSSVGNPTEKQAGEEDTPISTLVMENQGQGCSPFQHNPSTNEMGCQRRNGAGLRECLVDPDDALLLSIMGKDLREFTVVDCEVSLAGEVGVAAGRGQAEVCAASSDFRAESDELSFKASDTTSHVGAGVTPGDVERECPVCTELFDSGTHKQALLNCNHSFCNSCVKTIMEKAIMRSTSQIRCPVCRQRTPMPEWEIRQLQEEMTFLKWTEAGRVDRLAEVSAHPASERRLCSWLEQGFQQRLRTTRRCGYLPCLRYPLWLVNALTRCDRTCPWCYLCSILLLYVLELLCLSLIFTPVIILILLFTLLGKE